MYIASVITVLKCSNDTVLILFFLSHCTTNLVLQLFLTLALKPLGLWGYRLLGAEKGRGGGGGADLQVFQHLFFHTVAHSASIFTVAPFIHEDSALSCVQNYIFYCMYCMFSKCSLSNDQQLYTRSLESGPDFPVNDRINVLYIQ